MSFCKEKDVSTNACGWESIQKIFALEKRGHHPCKALTICFSILIGSGRPMRHGTRWWMRVVSGDNLDPTQWGQGHRNLLISYPEISMEGAQQVRRSRSLGGGQKKLFFRVCEQTRISKLRQPTCSSFGPGATEQSRPNSMGAVGWLERPQVFVVKLGLPGNKDEHLGRCGEKGPVLGRGAMEKKRWVLLRSFFQLVFCAWSSE